jgi:2TM domain
MNTPLTLEQRAQRRVNMKLGWGIHALVFVLVNTGLWLVAQGGNFGMEQRQPHFLPLWGWALGLSIHGVVTLAKLYGEGLSDRMVQGEVQRLRQREGR